MSLKKSFTNYKNEILIIFLLLVIGSVVYRVWLSFSIFVYGDGMFFFKEALKDFIIPSAWGWQGGPLLWHYPFSALYGVFGFLGFGTNIAEKFLIFWPIIFLGPIAGFLLVKKITGSNIAGFIGSLVFSYNTYFLSINTQSHILLPLSFIISTFAFLCFVYLLETKKNYLVPLSSILLFIVGFIDLRSFYVLSAVIFLYATYYQVFIEKNWKHNLKKNVSLFLYVYLTLFLLNLYWLIPSILTKSLTSNEYLSRTIFGSQFYNLQSSLAFFYPYWTGKEPTWLYVQKIPIYFWLYPILAFAGLTMAKMNRKIIFFGILALVGVFLTKQEASPFGAVYMFLFTHVPGFSAFREASKFDYLIVLSYSVLIGFFADFIWSYFKNKKLKYLFVFFIAFLLLWNTKPLITGEIRTMFVPINTPSDFVKLKNYILPDPNYSKVLGLSLNGKYVFSTYAHPEYDLLYSLAHFWGAETVTYDFENKTQAEGEKLMEYLSTDEARRLLSASSVEFVPVFIKDDPSHQSIRRDLGKEGSYFEKEMDKISYLRKIDLKMKNVILYKALDFKSHLYLTTEKETLKNDIPYKQVSSKMISPSEYNFQIKNLIDPIYLNFTELYDPSWRIHIGQFKWWEVLYKKEYFISDGIHSQNALRFNQFYLDPKEICSTIPCSFEATLYAKPQSYLYLGLIISSVTLIGVFVAIIYLFKKRNEKN